MKPFVESGVRECPARGRLVYHRGMGLGSDGDSAGYVLSLARLAAGGMGTTELCVRMRDRSHAGEFVVRKRPHTELLGDVEAMARFRQEGRIATRLNHPNLVRTLELGEDGRGPYLLLEYVHGITLQDLIDRAALRKRRFPTAAVIGIAGDCARALSALHCGLPTAGAIVHRDLCPENLLIRSDGRCLVSDFGVAKVHEATLQTDRSEVLGRIPYLSPEYLAGRELGPALDCYSLGIVLHTTLLGRLPFEARTEAALVTAILRGERSPVPAPREISSLIEQLTALAPAERITAAGLASLADELVPEESRTRALASLVDDLAGVDLARRMATWHELRTSVHPDGAR